MSNRFLSKNENHTYAISAKWASTEREDITLRAAEIMSPVIFNAVAVLKKSKAITLR